MKSARLTTLALACFFVLALFYSPPLAEDASPTNSDAHPAAYLDATVAFIPYGLDAQRIVSLAPNVTEMLFFLDLGDRVIGRSDFCNYPPEAAAIPSIGGFVDASLEKIVSLNPDLAVAYQGNSLELIDQLRTAGLTVLAFNEPKTVDEVGRQMEALHHIANPANTGLPVQLILWQAHLDQETISGYPESEHFRCFFGYPDETTYTCGGSSFISDLMLRAGAANVAAALSDPWPMVSTEFIVAAEPEWILTGTPCIEGKDPATYGNQLLEQLQADAVWSQLPAVRENRLIVIDADILMRPGPRLLDALRALNSAFTERLILDLSVELGAE